jgi:hypothetical protein
VDINVAEQVLEELFPSLEALETQNAAILQFLKDKGIATDQQLGPYLEQAGNASSVRWRAAKIRIKSIIASATKSAEQSAAKSAEQAANQQKSHKQMEKPQGDGLEKSEPKMAPQQEANPDSTAEDPKDRTGAKPNSEKPKNRNDADR